MSTILKLIDFYEEFTQSFLASNYEVVQSKRKLTFAKAVFYVPSIHPDTPLLMTSVVDKVFKNRNISLLIL